MLFQLTAWNVMQCTHTHYMGLTIIVQEMCSQLTEIKKSSAKDMCAC